jgi:hypothetical protein
MSRRPVNSGSAAEARAAAEAARRAAEEAARKAAEAAARRAAAEKAKNEAAAKSNKPQKPVATRDEFSATGAGQPQATSATQTAKPEEAKPGSLPAKPEELPKLFPELKNKSKEDLKKTYEAMKKLVEGNFSEQVGALGTLVKQFPDTTKDVLEKLGVKDNRLVKLATNSKALAALSKLTDEKASVADKAKAALELAHTAGSTFKPQELKGVLNHVLNGLPAGAKLAEAIGVFSDPNKSPIDKAKAALGLAEALKDFAGTSFPQLANELRKLDGTFRAVSAAITLLDPKASVKDKALAAAQLAAELPDLQNDLVAFKDALKQAGVKNVDEVVAQAGIDAAVKGLAPELASRLTPQQLQTVQELAAKVGPDKLEAVLKGIQDPKALDGLMGQLGKLDAAAGKRLLSTLGGMEHGNLAKVLSDPKTIEQLGTLATKLDDGAAGVLARIAKDIDPDGLKTLLKFTDGVSPDLLKTSLKGLDGVLQQGGGKLLGKALGVLDDVLGKMGIQVGKEVAEKVFKNLVKIIPFAGAVPGVIDAARYAKEAAELQGKNKDLGFFALMGAQLNGADAVVGTILSATGVGAAVDVGVGALFGVAELALDLAFDAEKAKYNADPQNYQAPGWMKAVNLAGAAAMGPAGAATLAAYYGPEGAAELAQWGIETGAKGAVELARSVGVSAAEATGDSLKLQAAMIRQLADVIRNPSKYGEAIATKARDTFNTVMEKGGQLATEARKILSGVIEDAKKLGEKGLDTLKFIAQNPGEAARMAVDGIKSLIETGGELLAAGKDAVLKKAVETLESLKAGWERLTGAAKEKAKELITAAGSAISTAINKAVEAGEKGLELLKWAVTHPGEVGALAKKAFTDVLAKGGELARKAWDGIRGLGAKGLELAESAIKSLKEAGGKAVETLKYIADNPGEAAAKVRDWVGQTLSDMVRKGGEAAKDAAIAIRDFVDRRVDWAKKFAVDLLKDGVDAFKEVAKAWAQNLTEGGKEILLALKDLGAAGVDALKDLASAGGKLAEAAVGYLGDLAKMGWTPPRARSMAWRGWAARSAGSPAARSTR